MHMKTPRRPHLRGRNHHPSGRSFLREKLGGRGYGGPSGMWKEPGPPSTPGLGPRLQEPPTSAP